ncbi:DNA breaking-rejoining enzyme [Mycena indigotica]|uniref:DNA breaking-rejoining enzyme n=1 Tax=Mycena indigotica TaxID=2126181 RepID=A0A8H6WBB2_9AGAR|nr:DNA breaking-rejoining enzyme [Mycena indigotica]KAF7306204.1 DNA breaking-rejoining enzyme [Mycena indigotica]
MLLHLRSGLNLTSSFDIAVFAAACVAFWGQCRLGELLPTSRTDPELSTKPCRNNITSTKHTITVRLPRTKTQKHGEDVILTAQCSEIDPISVLRMHLFATPNTPNTLLFTYSTGATTIPLTRRAFLNRCNEV